MKKLTTKKMLSIFTLCIIVLVPFILNLSFYLFKFGVINNYYSVNPAIIIYISIPFLSGIYIYNFIKSKRKVDKYDVIFFTFIFIGIICSAFSLNLHNSVFGKEIRHEGFLTLLGYYLLFINWKNYGTDEDYKKIKKIIYIIAIINSIYAILQIYTDFSFIARFRQDESMASGLCGNPNFFGSLIDIAISMITFEILSNDKKDIKKFLLFILLFISLINLQSTGPILTFILIIAIIFVYLKRNKILNIKKLIKLILSMIITFVLLLVLNPIIGNSYLRKTKRCELCNIKSNIDDGGNGRLYIWKNSLDIVKNNFITGVGYDNFYLAYKPNNFSIALAHIDDENNVQFNKRRIPVITDNAHNVYLHTLIVSGIFGLIQYLLLLLLITIKSINSKNKFILPLIVGFAAYSIQAFANISVIQVAPIYYILMGLIASSESDI